MRSKAPNITLTRTAAMALARVAWIGLKVGKVVHHIDNPEVAKRAIQRVEAAV